IGRASCRERVQISVVAVSLKKNIILGDTLSSDSEVPGKLNPIALSVNTQGAKYKINLNIIFQAEDGMRDKLVTGVQTCALPISPDLVGDDPAADPQQPRERQREQDLEAM